MALELDEDRVWTYEDYCQLPEDGTHYEVIAGRLHVTPAPRTMHQIIIGRLFEAFVALQNAGQCYVLLSPTDVRVADCDPVQPDLIVLRRNQRSLIQEKYVMGAPALVIEVLSPSNRRHDRVTKLVAYARAGIEHYWLVSPEDSSIEMLHLREGNYRIVAALGPGDVAESTEWPGFKLALNDLFCPLPED